MTSKHTRRGFLQAAGVGAALAADEEKLPPWSRGYLDIHHIATGRGSSTFMLCPDGTTLLVDCGAITLRPEVARYVISPRPDGSRRPGEWVARYVERHMRAAGRAEIDTFVLTHFHGDHMGEAGPEVPLSKLGNYRLSGIADLAEVIPVRRVVDRAYPDYAYPAPLDDASQKNYRAFVETHVRQGGTAERFLPGSAKQLRLREPAAFPTFLVRNLAANGEVWTGTGDTARHHFPPLSTLAPTDYPTENMCSLGFRISYGRFNYYTGGDMPANTIFGSQPWRDIETPVAQVAGPVDVAVANHHGYVDATGPGFVAALRPRCFVINAWDSAHPAMPAMNNMLSEYLYPGARDIYATAMKPESEIAVRQLAKLASNDGHVVIRVKPGGGEYSVFITASRDESGAIVKRFGPFTCA